MQHRLQDGDITDLRRRRAAPTRQADRPAGAATRSARASRVVQHREPRPRPGRRVAGTATLEEADRTTTCVERLRRFRGQPQDVYRVRSLVRHAAVEAGVDVDAAVVAASELSSNVVLHAKTPFGLTVVVRPGRLRGELSDGSARLPKLARSLVGYSEHGRGVRIVDALTDRWGVEGSAGGKVVWFELGH